MSKFKVGDYVNNSTYGIGVVKEVCFEVIPQLPYKVAFENCWHWMREDSLTLSKPVKEFIVIRCENRDVIASHKRGDEIVKTAKATCAPNDEFNFETGAKLAFDRLMGREEPLYNCIGSATVKPQPAPRFKVGDRVMTSIGVGMVVEVDPDIKEGKPYRIRYDDGCAFWKNSDEAKPAPEPKYYTGRVVCISGEYGIGKIYTVVNGRFTDKTMNIALPYKSVEHMNDTFLFGKVAEVKE